MTTLPPQFIPKSDGKRFGLGRMDATDKNLKPWTACIFSAQIASLTEEKDKLQGHAGSAEG